MYQIIKAVEGQPIIAATLIFVIIVACLYALSREALKNGGALTFRYGKAEFTIGKVSNTSTNSQED